MAGPGLHPLAGSSGHDLQFPSSLVLPLTPLAAPLLGPLPPLKPIEVFQCLAGNPVLGLGCLSPSGNAHLDQQREPASFIVVQTVAGGADRSHGGSSWGGTGRASTQPN